MIWGEEGVSVLIFWFSGMLQLSSLPVLHWFCPRWYNFATILSWGNAEMLWDVELGGNYFWGSASGTPWLICSMLKTCCAEIGIPSNFCFSAGIWLVDMQGRDTNRREEKDEWKRWHSVNQIFHLLWKHDRGRGRKY